MTSSNQTSNPISIRLGTLEDVLKVDGQIPEFDGRTTLQKLTSRIADKPHLILIACVETLPIGYKIGYQLNNDEFYSWLGGVSPKYRKQGIATALRHAQEKWAKQHGYKSISVKSMNRYPAMLQLLISSGYQISGYIDNGDVHSSKIQFKITL